jgi:serine/threonine-protein kinase
VANSIPGYNILKKLGQGARSQVFQVVDSATGEIFALKRVIRGDDEDTRFLDQAINEHEVASRFTHPSLRRSFSLRRIRRLFRLAEVHVIMEYVEGFVLDQKRPNRVEASIDLFIKLAEGLGHMHSLGYLHTDIKPNNVLLAHDGSIKIIDFGQSCRIGFKKPRIQGTPDYIAPEQVERRRLTRRTDVYNLGATLYWALTGQAYPTAIGKGGQRQDAKRRDLVPQPHELNNEVPPSLSKLAMDCCHHDPLRRPMGMKEVISRLETVRHVLATRPSSAPEPSASDKGERPDHAPPRKPLITDVKHEEMYDYSAFHDLGEDDEEDLDTETSPGGGA